MSAIAHDHFPQDSATDKARIRVEALFPGALILGAIGTLISIILMFTGADTVGMQGSYIFGYIFWMTITMGCFGFFILYHLIRPTWMLPVLRLLEAGGGAVMLTVMGLLFLPVLLPILAGNSAVYEWASAANRESDALLRHKAPYLNPLAFTVRFVIYFAVWIGMAIGFKASSLRQEKTGDLRERLLRNNWAGASFVFFALSVTFAFTDWVMSIDAHWSSTMYGLWTGVNMCIGGFSFCVVMFCLNADRQPYKSVITPKVTRDMGNVLFTLTMLWAYTSLSQYLIIWSGNLPETNFYYVERSKMGWNLIGAICVIGQFFLPFVMLLTPRNKKIPKNLAGVAGFMFVVHIFDIYQYVLPALRHTGPMPQWTDFLAFGSIGLLWLGIFAAVTRRSPLLVTFDTRLQEAAHDAH